jgi:hypothetical protein
MADKETIINGAVRNMRAGKLNQAYKLTLRREVEKTAIAKVRARNSDPLHWGDASML